MYDKLQIIIPLREIPVGSVVMKVGGTTKFIVQDELRVYAEDETLTITASGAGARYLIPRKGMQNGVNAYPDDRPFIWVLSERELYEWLQERDEARNSG